MERIKQMSLKKSLFTLTFGNLLIAIILSIFAFWGCMEIRSQIASHGVIIYTGTSPVTITPQPEPTAQTILLARVFEVLQYALPILFFICSSFSTAVLFYHFKLKNPVAILTNGANRIIANDLDFSIKVDTTDELGQLCIAFEKMRQALVANHKELWRHTEERKRLNAAFSHDLRNPVTVLKGSVKLAKQGYVSGKATQAQIIESLTRIEDYTNRIERYIEIMSSVQKLEHIPLSKKQIDWNELVSELKNVVALVGMESNKKISFEAINSSKTISVDKSILYQITENLVANALRYAKDNILITIVMIDGNIELSVQDDGDGFPAILIKKGIQPFQKCNEETEHFGMGLYICNLLCQNHGGKLKLENNQIGAIVTAILRIE